MTMRARAIFATAVAALAGTALLAPGAGAVTLPCSNANLNGAYSVKFDGYVGRLPLSGAGILVFDGNGNVTTASVLAFSRDYHVFQNVAASGTYAVNSNCTGSIALTVNLGNGQQNYVIAVNSTGFVGIQADPDTSVSVVGRL
jgi:hypothetical protein